MLTTKNFQEEINVIINKALGGNISPTTMVNVLGTLITALTPLTFPHDRTIDLHPASINPTQVRGTTASYYRGVHMQEQFNTIINRGFAGLFGVAPGAPTVAAMVAALTNAKTTLTGKTYAHDRTLEEPDISLNPSQP